MGHQISHRGHQGDTGRQRSHPGANHSRGVAHAACAPWPTARSSLAHVNSPLETKMHDGNSSGRERERGSEKLTTAKLKAGRERVRRTTAGGGRALRWDAAARWERLYEREWSGEGSRGVVSGAGPHLKAGRGVGRSHKAENVGVGRRTAVAASTERASGGWRRAPTSGLRLPAAERGKEARQRLPSHRMGRPSK
jgi:hypothetical protein